MGRNKKSNDIAHKVRWLYANTAMSVNEIGKSFKISPTTVNNMIMRLGAYQIKEENHIVRSKKD